MPVTPRTRDDLVWAAAIFELKGRSNVQGSQLMVMINGRQVDSFQQRLVTLFGGKAYAFGGNILRWQIGGAELLTFLEEIQPFLGAGGLEKHRVVVSMIEGLRQLRAGRRRETSETVAPAAPMPRVDSFNLLAGVDEDQLVAIAGWVVGEKDAEGNLLLKAQSVEHARKWVIALELQGFDVFRTHEILIHVKERRADV